MLRAPPTRILLSNYEVHQTLHSIWTKELKTFNLSYSKPLSEIDEEEAEYGYDSSSASYTRSSSAQYSMSEDDRRACEVLKLYRDRKIYMNSSTSDSDDLPAYSVGPHAALDARSTDPSESYQTEVCRNVIEIPDFQISSTPQGSPVETATIILSPRSPEPIPRARSGSRMHRPGYYEISLCCRIKNQMPMNACRTSSCLILCLRVPGSINSYGKPDHQPASCEMHIPVSRLDGINRRTGFGTCLYNLQKKKISTAIVKAQSTDPKRIRVRELIIGR